jgi:hypothetical protein
MNTGICDDNNAVTWLVNKIGTFVDVIAGTCVVNNDTICDVVNESTCADVNTLT